MVANWYVFMFLKPQVKTWDQINTLRHLDKLLWEYYGKLKD